MPKIKFKPCVQKKTLYVMRGLVACGKSFTAKRLAGSDGIICAEDDYFYTENGDDPSCYDFDKNKLKEAGKWNDARFLNALKRGVSPVVLDQGNSTAFAPKKYVEQAITHGYTVIVKEPESPWWRCIRELLKDKGKHEEELNQWAMMLETLSATIHRVPYKTIYARMARWESDITVDDILKS